MRYLKKLLLGIFIFLAVFTVACYIGWLITGAEPQALIAGVFAGAGVEVIASGMIKFKEIKSELKHKGDTYGHNADNLNVNSSVRANDNVNPYPVGEAENNRREV